MTFALCAAAYLAIGCLTATVARILGEGVGDSLGDVSFAVAIWPVLAVCLVLDWDLIRKRRRFERMLDAAERRLRRRGQW